MEIKEKQRKILFVILENGVISSSAIHEQMIKEGEKVSLVTIKRALTEMVSSGLLIVSGFGPAIKYKVSIIGRLFAPIDTKKYCVIEPDKRYGISQYNFELLSGVPPDIFDKSELEILNDATNEYKRRTKDPSDVIQKKELERLIIELAWKSSKIEGNTYTLLDTEKLIREQKEAVGHDKDEARMILNHKDAFDFIYQNKKIFKTITRTNLEQLHAILVKDLNINLQLRKKPVGVVGSKYQPLDNGYHIKEAIQTLEKTIARISSPYAKALVALLGISYIQPFEDGNKRTSRLMANALLLAHGLAPLSYRSVDENEYREAMLVFYEVNSLIPFKDIFIEQYKFSATSYAVK